MMEEGGNHLLYSLPHNSFMSGRQALIFWDTKYKMEEGAWTGFCSISECSDEVAKTCGSGFSAIVSPHTCINHALTISVDIVLLLIFLFVIINRKSIRKVTAASQPQQLSSLLILSVIFNSFLAVAYLVLGIWIIIQKLNTNQTVLPLHEWLVVLCQGLTCVGCA